MFEATVAAFAAALADPAAPAACRHARAARDAGPEALLGLPQQCRGRAHRRASRRAIRSTRRIVGADAFRARGARLRPGAQASLGGADRLWRRLPGLPRRSSPISAFRASPTWRGSRTPGSRPITPPRRRPRPSPISRRSLPLPCRRRASPFIPAARLLSFLDARPPRSGPPIRSGACRRAAGGRSAEDALVTRPEADVTVRVLPPHGYAFASRLQDGATFAEASGALPNPDGFGPPSGRSRRGRRDRRDRPRRGHMSAGVASPAGPAFLAPRRALHPRAVCASFRPRLRSSSCA